MLPSMRLLCLLICCLLMLSACTPPQQRPSPPAAPVASDPPVDPIAELLAKAPPLEKLGFAVQVGAFSQLENAVRLEQRLQAQGVDAYHFRHESGLYKVRFGNHGEYATAKGEATRLRQQGVIGNFFIVLPEDYAAVRIAESGHGDLRQELVSTIRRFIGVPYRWGGEDRENGFDCSGLTMVSYRLNGLNLPRNSRMQYKAGSYVAKQNLQQGDLVFFATKGGKRVTHVGMYVGGDNFIHAPRTGKTVRVASLANSFWKKTYVGGRTYL